VRRRQDEHRGDEREHRDRCGKGATRTQILGQVASPVLPGDADAEHRERDRGERDRNARDEERPTGDVQVLNAAPEREEPAPLGNVGHAEARRHPVRHGAHRLADIQHARGTDEDADHAQLRERDERGRDLLAHGEREHRDEVRNVMPEQQPAARDTDRDRALGVRRGPQAGELGADEAVRSGPSSHEERANEHRSRGALPGEDQDREHRDDRRRHGRGDVGGGVAEQPDRAQPAREDREREPGEQPRGTREHDDEQRGARADENEAEQVATDGVGAEQERQARGERPVGPGRPVDQQKDRLVWGDPVPVECDEQEEATKDEPHEEPGIEAPHVRTVQRCASAGSPVQLRERRGVPSKRILGRN